jgi:hypothetical protein
MTRVQVSPAVLNWALELSGRHPGELASKLPGLRRWPTGEGLPTLRQLEAFAKATYTPFGYLFLTEPPEDRLPIPNVRGHDTYLRPHRTRMHLTPGESGSCSRGPTGRIGLLEREEQP